MGRWGVEAPASQQSWSGRRVRAALAHAVPAGDKGPSGSGAFLAVATMEAERPYFCNSRGSEGSFGCAPWGDLVRQSTSEEPETPPCHWALQPLCRWHFVYGLTRALGHLAFLESSPHPLGIAARGGRKLPFSLASGCRVP